MNADELLATLGPPDIEVGTLRFWVHDRERPATDDEWDGNWVESTVHCSAEGAEVRVRGPILRLDELQRWADACRRMQGAFAGRADLECVEPNLHVGLEIDPAGHVQMTVDITADSLYQKHQFHFEIDQSYLSGIIQGCRAVLQRFPMRGRLGL